MRIALLVLDITYVGGIERVVSNLSNLFVKKGHSVEIISCFKSNEKAFYKINKEVNINYLNYEKFTKKMYFKMYKKLKLYLKESNADIIISFSTNINIFLAKLRKNFKNIVIASEHAQFNAHNIIIRGFKRIYYNNLDCIVTLNKTDENYYKNFISKTKCIPNAVSVLKKSDTIKRKKMIFAAGRLHKDKGFDQLIMAFNLISKQNLEWTLEIAGEGPEKNNLLNLIKENNLEKQVKIIPFQECIDKNFKEASIYAMSSRQECFPMVLIEAMSTGLPVISYDCPNGPRDIIKDKEDGILVKLNDIQGYSNYLNYLIQNKEVRKRLGREAKKNIKRFEEEKISEKWKDLFQILKG